MAQHDESADLDMFDSEEDPSPAVRPFDLRPGVSFPERSHARDERAYPPVCVDDDAAGTAVIGRLQLAAAPRRRSGMVAVLAVSLIALVGGAGVLGAYLYDYDPALPLGWPLHSAVDPNETRAVTDTEIDMAAANATRPRDTMPLVGTAAAGTAGPVPASAASLGQTGASAPPVGIGVARLPESETVVPASDAAPRAERATSAPPPPPAAREAPVPVSRPPASARPAAVAPTTDVSGEWTLAMRVESSTLDYFEGIRLGYEIRLQQHGTIVTGTGMKVSENGVTIGTSARTPIDIWGTHEGNRLQLSFNQRGAWHPRSGTLGLLAENGAALQGRFATDPDPSTGTVEARRRD